MSLLTTIYKFIKPELTDSPPDITATNPNWDKLDTELKRQDDARIAHEAEKTSRVVLITEPWNQLTKTTVNLGFKPKTVSIVACIIDTIYESNGFADGDSQYAIHAVTSLTGKRISSPSVYFYNNSTNYILGNVSFTDTGIEISWQASGTITGVTGNRRLAISAITHGGV